MKKILFIFLILIVSDLFGENFSLNGEYMFQSESCLDEMIIEDQNVIIKYKQQLNFKEEKKLSYKITQLYGLPYIEFGVNLPKEIAEYDDYKNNFDSITTDNKLLFLACKRKNFITMFAFTLGFSFEKRPLTYTRFDEWGNLYKDCSSYLIEKNKAYPVENLRKLVVDTPWVEGVKGDGIGEGFTIEGKQFAKPLGPYLFIINGYISYEKPYLYKQNNRIKKIKVTGLKSGNSRILDVLDTPHPQTVDISFITQPEDIRVEIADVYKGTKYDDTCLHYCFAYDEEVIPYENSITE
ncbi:hypothetical protein SAMN04487775_11244 [Treponema bryantii]|uniref:NAD glycohydrolase translocation F5/8 type C domain-containing protein n=1 Tax=Treponema bryantii TaxID=163 RepID=A0A1I3N5B0_9SPIR|nr:hypothetical protein [Treponema bryantii]SFJ04458.1 hypothetical protein SAMN04487775_11244 [Treponema bryantii]